MDSTKFSTAQHQQVTLETLIVENRLETTKDLATLTEVFAGLPDVVSAYLEFFYPTPHSDDVDYQTKLEILPGPSLDAALVKRGYTVTSSEALLDVYNTLRDDVVTLVNSFGYYSTPPDGAFGFAWDYVDDHYRLFVYNYDLPREWEPRYLLNETSFVVIPTLDTLLLYLARISPNQGRLLFTQPSPDQLSDRDYTLMSALSQVVDPARVDVIISRLFEENLVIHTQESFEYSPDFLSQHERVLVAIGDNLYLFSLYQKPRFYQDDIDLLLMTLTYNEEKWSWVDVTTLSNN